jgi:hypothetical protein
MADDSAIKIGVETNISSLRAGMAEAQSVIASSTAQMRESYAGVGTAATASAAKIHLVGEASANSVSAHKAAAGAMRELEGNFTRNTRAADQFLISSLKLGPVLQAAFPIIGAAAFAGILVDVGGKMFDAFDAGGERARKTAEDIESNSISMRHMNDSLDVELDKLQMANAKLEHKPITNAMKTAIDEAAEAADTLYEKLGGDLRRIEETVKGMSGTTTEQMLGIKGSTKDEQRMVQDHIRYLSEQSNVQGQLNESISYGVALQKHLNDMQEKMAHPSATAMSNNYTTQIEATQHLITMQGQEQRAIQATIALEAEQGKHNALEAKLEGQREASKGAEASLKSIETEYESLSATEASFTGHGLTAGEALSFWAPYLTTFKAKSEEAKHVMAEYVKAQEEIHKQLEAIKSSMKKSDFEDFKMAEVSPEINKWIVAQADDVLRTGEAWKEYHDAIDKSSEIQAQAKEQIQLANIHAMEAAGSISKLAAAQDTAAIHAANYKAKIQALREELERLQKEEKDYLAQTGLHNPKNLAQQQQVQNQITQVQGQADTSAVQDNAAIQQQIQAPYLKAFDNINSGWLRVQDQMLYSTRNISMAFAKMGQSILTSTINAGEKMVLKAAEHDLLMLAHHQVTTAGLTGADLAAAQRSDAIANESQLKKMFLEAEGLFHHQTIETAKTTTTATSTAAQTGLATTGAVAATTATTTAATTQITAHAGVAAAGAAASQASIPWVGPAMAAGAAIAMMGLVMGFAKFEDGTGYIPRTGMAMLHEGEAVIPAPTMQELRGSSGGGDITINQNNNISAANEKAIIAAINRNPHVIAGALRRHLRQGGH